MSWRDNKFFYLTHIGEWGWSVQITPWLEFGHCKAPNLVYNYRYIDWRLPFGLWHYKDWGCTINSENLLPSPLVSECKGMTTTYGDSCDCG